MRNLTNPIRATSKVFSLSPQKNTVLNHSLYLAPNDFEDDQDMVGLVHSKPDEYFFFTIHEHNIETKATRDQAEEL